MLSLILEVQQRMTVVSLMYARIVPIFVILPVLNNSVISNMMIRNAVIFAIIIGIWPAIDTDMMAIQLGSLNYVALAAKEVMIGGSIGCVLALPFWLFSALGTYIDVGRGSSMGSLIDPTSGQESTEMSNFVSFCVCVMYLELGGLKMMLITLVQSYHNIGLDDGIKVNISVALQFLGELFEHGFILAAPVLLTLFLTEALLGLLSRFTPQLSAFSVAMTIKSTIAIFILSLYFGYMMPDQLPQFMQKYAQWHLLEGVKR